MRKLGILLGISSLPCKYGIGTLGKSAYRFADLLQRSGVKVWQILPIGPTSYGDSPYQSYSTFAGNPYFIDLDTLVEEGVMKKSDLPPAYPLNEGYTDYGTLYAERYLTLKKAFDHSFEKLKDKIDAFKAENEWLSDYALYMAIKEENGGKSWQEWDNARLKKRTPSAMAKAQKEYGERISFHCFLQYLFYRQFHRFKAYVNSLGIELLGDMPIYVALDSSDVWANPSLFELDRDLRPTKVAGVPPDYFSADGQLWGNPVYNWSKHKRTGYDWWIRRLASATSQFDIVRLDHFIGFARYYTVPARESTARNGTWEKGVGASLFNAAEQKLGKLHIIAEDLGVLTDDVIRLREKLRLAGMNVIQFCFDAGSGYAVLPSEVKEHSVLYSGTHDNDTLLGWWQEQSEASRRFILEKLGIQNAKDPLSAILLACAKSKAELAVIPLQDLLCLDSAARMNTPGTVGNNWKWRVDKKSLNAKLSDRIHSLAEKSDRLQPNI